MGAFTARHGDELYLALARNRTMRAGRAAKNRGEIRRRTREAIRRNGNGNYLARIGERVHQSIGQPTGVLMSGALVTLLHGIREGRYVSVSRRAYGNLSEHTVMRETYPETQPWKTGIHLKV